MKKLRKILLLLTLLTFVLAGCFNSIDYKELLIEELDEIYSLENARYMFGVQLETTLNENYETNNEYINSWLEYLKDDFIKIDSVLSIFKNNEEIKLSGEFAFMEGPQTQTAEIVGYQTIAFDFYVKRDDGVYFRSEDFKSMHDYFGFESKDDYAKDYIEIYGSETANEVIDLINDYMSISEGENNWSDLLINEKEDIEDESAKFTYNIDVEQITESLNTNEGKLSKVIKTFLDITDWEVRYLLVNERLDNSTFIVNLDESSEKLTGSIFDTFYLEMSRYVYPHDEPIDPR
ncbi:MAG: hypothetical protein ACLFPS_03100 [Clostridia bacterium]